ncbi:MAG: D-alanyl-D-alanine carboxypeptidase/D-alanyl-D-alanine-endopeptidase [Acidobacteriota bacterium]
MNGGRRVLVALAAGATLAAAPAGAAPAGELGCLAIRGETVLESAAAERRKTPASVQKLAVTAAALHTLGPDFHVTTRVLAAGPVTSGPQGTRRLRGDLVLEAAGDPTWSDDFFDGGAAEPLGALARAVRDAGIDAVDGDLVVDLSRFPGRPAPPSRSIGDLAFGFGAPTGGVAVDANTTSLTMAPGAAVGEPPRFTADGVEVVNRARTVDADRRDRGTVDFQATWDDGRLVIRGEYPISEPSYRITVAVADGERRAARAFRRALAALGVEVTGDIELSRRAVAGRPVASLASPPLAEWLPPILGDSDNWLADMLLRVLAAEHTGAGRLGDGVRWLDAFLTDEVGLHDDAVHLDDASGLSPHNLWTPRAVVDLLAWAERQPWRTVYRGALARTGGGTLKAWPGLPSTLGAKTGTLTHTLGLAGYLETPGQPVIFACLLNHDTAPRPRQRRMLTDKVWRWHKLTSEGSL